MSQTVIDSKTQTVKFGFWPAKEEITTTLQLLNLGKGDFGIDYHSKFSGIKDGEVKGGPISIDGNLTKVVNKSPEVKVIVSNYNKTNDYISMHVKIDVDIPVIGNETIYEQTLGGSYIDSTGWDVSLANVEKSLGGHKNIEAVSY
ncbi:hypothetical protein [Aquimarina sediminis]|uniref:hypothetical protein n=1 Tax=Aquimarina sediminis TaxID=2070536 RepID=UPI000CA01054|nr:hypothetical protein [Aquimarina sediminis]